jgi:multiple sugar transport system substrate-binding protein
MKRLCVFTAVLALIALPAAGLPFRHAAAAPQHATTIIRFINWASAETATSATIGKVIKDFEAQHPGVKIVSQAVPFDQMYQQLVTQASASNLADVQQLNGPWTQELGGSGALADIGKIADKSYLADNWSGALDAGKYHGTLYSVPYILTPHAFWYNKKLMTQAGLNPHEPPRTLSQLNADLPILKAKLGSKGIYPIGIDTTKIDYALIQFFPYFYMFGAYPLYGGKPGFNTPGVTRALSWLRMVVKKGYTPVGQQIKDERDLMAKGKIVFKLDGPYFVGILQSLNPALNGDKNFYGTFGVTTVPVGYNGKSQTLADIHQLGIAASSKNKKMDWEFIKYLTSSSDSVHSYMLPLGGVPPLKSEERQPSVLKAPVNRIYVNTILKTMVGGPYSPKYGQQLQIIIQALQEAALTNTPISQIQKSTQAALARTM